MGLCTFFWIHVPLTWGYRGMGFGAAFISDFRQTNYCTNIGRTNMRVTWCVHCEKMLTLKSSLLYPAPALFLSLAQRHKKIVFGRVVSRKESNNPSIPLPPPPPPPKKKRKPPKVAREKHDNSSMISLWFNKKPRIAQSVKRFRAERVAMVRASLLLLFLFFTHAHCVEGACALLYHDVISKSLVPHVFWCLNL